LLYATGIRFASPAQVRIARIVTGAVDAPVCIIGTDIGRRRMGQVIIN
jgi:hypothetical protein